MGIHSQVLIPERTSLHFSSASNRQWRNMAMRLSLVLLVALFLVQGTLGCISSGRPPRPGGGDEGDRPRPGDGEDRPRPDEGGEGDNPGEGGEGDNPGEGGEGDGPDGGDGETRPRPSTAPGGGDERPDQGGENPPPATSAPEKK